ncbi:agmatine N-acetyltransferase [Aphomia sociella]
MSHSHVLGETPSVPLGQIWSRFKGRERDGKPAKMYQIRDMDEKDKRRCLDLMQEVFLRDEPLSEILKIHSDPVSLKTIRKNWESFVTQNVSLACFTEDDQGDPDELVGFNIIIVRTISDPESEFKHEEGESWNKLMRTLLEAESLVNVFKHYEVDTYLSSSGLTVLPEHRGQNIGARMFAAREPLCKALGIKATCTVYTAYTSQALAAKCGYEVIATLEYEDMMKYGIDLRGLECPNAKVMGVKFDF